MKGSVIAVLVVAGILGLTAIVLGFAGEATRIKDDQVLFSDDGYCYYPTSPAMALGIVATILLLIEQIVVSVGARCFCCRRPPCPSACGGICALICFIFSWLVFAGAFAMLIAAACLNNMYYLVKNYSSDSNPCPVAKPGFFAGAGVMCIISVALGLTSYIVSIYSDKESVAKSGVKSTDNGIAMAQPQMPPVQQVPSNVV